MASITFALALPPAHSDGWMEGSFVTSGKQDVELGLRVGLLVKDRSQLHCLEVALSSH